MGGDQLGVDAGRSGGTKALAASFVEGLQGRAQTVWDSWSAHTEAFKRLEADARAHLLSTEHEVEPTDVSVEVVGVANGALAAEALRQFDAIVSARATGLPLPAGAWSWMDQFAVSCLALAEPLRAAHAAGIRAALAEPPGGWCGGGSVIRSGSDPWLNVVLSSPFGQDHGRGAAYAKAASAVLRERGMDVAPYAWLD